MILQLVNWKMKQFMINRLCYQNSAYLGRAPFNSWNKISLDYLQWWSAQNENKVRKWMMKPAWNWHSHFLHAWDLLLSKVMHENLGYYHVMPRFLTLRIRMCRTHLIQTMNGPGLWYFIASLLKESVCLIKRVGRACAGLKVGHTVCMLQFVCPNGVWQG